MKRLSLFLMLLSVSVTVAAFDLSQTTDNKMQARGQPEIQQNLMIVPVEIYGLQSENCSIGVLEIIMTNLSVKDDLIVCTGDRKLRDVDWCNKIQRSYILDKKALPVISNYMLPHKFGLSIRLYC